MNVVVGVLGIIAIICIVYGVRLGVIYNSPKHTEERKNEFIILSQNIAEEYQGKEITECKGFLVKKANSKVELSKINDGFVFCVSFDDQVTSKQVEIKFPARVDEGILKIGVEYPIVYEDDWLDFGTFLFSEIALIGVAIISIFGLIIQLI